MSDKRYEHYYSLEADEVEDGFIFCTAEEGRQIFTILKTALPDVTVTVEGRPSRYDYTTEGDIDASTVAHAILGETGFEPL